MLYKELYNFPFATNFKPPALGPPKDYQSIPDAILSNYVVDTSHEDVCIQEYNDLKAFQEAVKQEKTAVANAKLDREKRLEEERLLEIKRKAPGLSDDILQPTKQDTSAAVESKINPDFSEFDQLKSTVNVGGINDDFQLLKEIMSSENIHTGVEYDVSKQFQSMNVNQSPPQHRIDQSFSPTHSIQYSTTPPLLSGPLSRKNHESPNHSQHYLQQQSWLVGNQTRYGSPPNASLPPPMQHQWQPQSIPKPSLPTQHSPSHLASNDILPNSASDQYIQMGFNLDSIKRATKLYSTEQEILDFLFLFEELVRQGHDSDASQRIIEVVGVKDRTTILSILVNVSSLMDMGFSGVDTVDSLYSTKNDKNRALDILLNK